MVWVARMFGLGVFDSVVRECVWTDVLLDHHLGYVIAYQSLSSPSGAHTDTKTRTFAYIYLSPSTRGH